MGWAMVAKLKSGEATGLPQLALPALRGASAERLTGTVDCASSKIRDLYRWWHRAADGQMPLWSQFDVVEHRHTMPNLYLVKRMSPGRWAFSLKGEAVQAILPSGPLPETIGDLDDIDEATNLTAYYEDVARFRQCHLVRGTVTTDRNETIEIEAIDCPFEGGAAGGITILGVLECVAVHPAMPPL